MDEPGCIVISSSHVNAVGIAASLREIGWNGRVICLRINGGSYLAGSFPNLCEMLELSVEEPCDFVRELSTCVAPPSIRALFFTEERLLPAFVGNGLGSMFPNAAWSVGTESFLECVLDRWKFYEFIAQHQLGQVPKCLRSDENPWNVLGNQLRLRVWRSWDGMKKLPRGRNAYSRADVDRWQEECKTQMLQPEQWGFQELLSVKPQHNVSVCGWHDSEVHYYVVTRKCFERNENGWIVEALDGYTALKRTTEKVLEALEYSGPFELEFVLNDRTGEYCIIELNPRFWMQHRLASILGEHCLVRRYLGERIGPSANNRSRMRRFWLDTSVFMPQLLSRRGYWLWPYMYRAVWATPVYRSITLLLHERYPNWMPTPKISSFKK